MPRPAACLLALALLGPTLNQARANPPIRPHPPVRQAKLALPASNRAEPVKASVRLQDDANAPIARLAPRSAATLNHSPVGLARSTAPAVSPAGRIAKPGLATPKLPARTRVVFYLNVQPAYVAWQPEADLLRKAYVALSLADHDYDGHRVAALRQTALAGEIVGIHLRGDGYGEETQAESDAHLQDARTYLEQALPLAGNAAAGQLAGYIEQAIGQIDTAWRID